jgi:hypothetical protein
VWAPGAPQRICVPESWAAQPVVTTDSRRSLISLSSGGGGHCEIQEGAHGDPEARRLAFSTRKWPSQPTSRVLWKYVVSSTLDRVDWNAELVRGDLGKAVAQLKRESGKGLFVAGVKLAMVLVERGLIVRWTAAKRCR